MLGNDFYSIELMLTLVHNTPSVLDDDSREKERDSSSSSSLWHLCARLPGEAGALYLWIGWLSLFFRFLFMLFYSDIFVYSCLYSFLILMAWLFLVSYILDRGIASNQNSVRLLIFDWCPWACFFKKRYFHKCLYLRTEAPYTIETMAWTAKDVILKYFFQSHDAIIRIFRQNY